MNHPYLTPGQDVIYVGADKKQHKAKITEVFTQDCARVESDDGKHSAIAQFSDSGEINTFHFEPASPKAEKPTEAITKK
jgi:hypothetical protein